MQTAPSGRDSRRFGSSTGLARDPHLHSQGSMVKPHHQDLVSLHTCVLTVLTKGRARGRTPLNRRRRLNRTLRTAVVERPGGEWVEASLGHAAGAVRNTVVFRREPEF